MEQVKLFKQILLIGIFWTVPLNFDSSSASPLSITNSTIGEGPNFYYGTDVGWQQAVGNADDVGGDVPYGNGANRREKRLVISGLAASILWSILFTPLATMTVSKNLDLLDVLRRCNSRGKAHFENEHPLTAFLGSIACKETEAETRGKIVLIEIVTLAFQHMTSEARDLIAIEYALFEQKMNKLRVKKDEQEQLKWNVPGHRGKIFLCFLREYVLFDESTEPDSAWSRQFDNDADKGQEFWRHCEASIKRRREMSWKGRMARSIERWYRRKRGKIECIMRKMRDGISWVGDFITKFFGGGVNKSKEEIGKEEAAKVVGECTGPRRGLFDELRESGWPTGYDDIEDPTKELMKYEILNGERFLELMRGQMGATREEPLGAFSNYLRVNETEIVAEWENLMQKDDLYYPKGIRLIIDKTLEEAKRTLDYYNLYKISNEQKKHFAMLEIRTCMAHFFVELRKNMEFRKIFFPRQPEKGGFGKGPAKEMFARENEIGRDWLVAGNDLHMDDLSEIFRMQDENEELYREIMLDALLYRENDDAEDGEEFAGNVVVEREEGGQRREKRAIGAITTLLFGIGMQQGYRHFNLIQLFRDCIIRSVNYMSARCYPPPIIQEEIKFIQQAKEIAIQEITKETVVKIGKKLAIFVKEYLRRKDALVDVPLGLLKTNLDLVVLRGPLTTQKSIPVPIRAFRKIPMADKPADHRMLAVPSQQLREAIAESNRIPRGTKSYQNLADAIIDNGKVQIPLKLYNEWKNDLSRDERVPPEKIRYCKKHNLDVTIRGKAIKRKLLKLANDEVHLESGELPKESPIPNPKDILAPLLKPGRFIDVALNFFTVNDKLDQLQLLHTPLAKLEELFEQENAKISVPINFLVERYKEPTLNVTFDFIREWVRPEQNVQIVFDANFVAQMGAKQIRAIAVPTLWLLASVDEKETIHVAGEHFILNYEEMCHNNRPVTQFPLLIELKNKFLRRIKCRLSCPKRHYIKMENFVRPIGEKVLNFNMDELEKVDYLPLEMATIKEYANDKMGQFGGMGRCPRNILVTLEWLVEKKKEHDGGSNNKSPFIVPILRKFFDDFVYKQIEGKRRENGGKEIEMGEMVAELGVPIPFLADIMKSSQAIPVPSKMLSDAGLELPWKYARYLDCNAEYLFYDEETLNRCKIYREELEKIGNHQREKSENATD